MAPKVNKILGFYSEDGSQVTDDRFYSYAQVELLGKHAEGIKKKIEYDESKKCSKNIEFEIDERAAKRVSDDSEGFIMLVSREDLNLVINYQWYLNSNGYPATYGSIHSDEEHWSAPYPLHRFLVLNVPEGYVVDHINRNRLDNRRCNLRIITSKQNSYNRKKPKNAKSEYKGVRKMGKGKFKAVISKDGKTFELKDFTTEKDAAIAYDFMAEELFGPHAGKNFPD